MSRTNVLKTSVPQTTVNTVTSVLQSLHSGIRIELINAFWARGIGRTSGTAGWVLSSTLNCEPFIMDVHSSSLLSPIAPAPDKLAEERSALSQVYSDTRSNDSELSSLQPLRSPQHESQDATLVTDESILITQIVDNLKNLGDFDILYFDIF